MCVRKFYCAFKRSVYREISTPIFYDNSKQNTDIKSIHLLV